MKRKRNKLEMIRDILIIIKNNRKIRITPLIYKSNLSSNSIKPYIEDLLKNKMIEQFEVEGNNYFRITKNGEDFITEFSKMKIFAESFGLQEEL